MRHVIPILAAVVIGSTGATSAANAALVDFGVAALGGTITFGGGATLDKSSSLDLDDSLLIVSSLSANDSSGLSVFPGGADNTVTLTHPISYGSGTGTMNTPLGADVIKMWTGLINGVSDTFTETLTTVTEINRNTKDAITITLVGSLSDSLNMFMDTPAKLILTASEVGGPGAAIGASLTNTASNVPEPATWVMMGLGFAALGYAAVRRSSKDQAALTL
ncbi:MAG TPA: PEP-CTERM sorting domain-containing protein [Roseiarcus sp.]|nr:PEP-CTERM sorting domain-containing protein [Roseiarcus sp.]